MIIFAVFCASRTSFTFSKTAKTIRPVGEGAKFKTNHIVHFEGRWVRRKDPFAIQVDGWLAAIYLPDESAGGAGRILLHFTAAAAERSSTISQYLPPGTVFFKSAIYLVFSENQSASYEARPALDVSAAAAATSVFAAAAAASVFAAAEDFSAGDFVAVFLYSSSSDVV